MTAKSTLHPGPSSPAALAPLAPLIPRWLDDLRLPLSQFRVLCHLWRRGGRNRLAFPGGASICDACCISDKTLWTVLAALEKQGLIRRSKHGHNSNSYTLLIPGSVASEPEGDATLASISGFRSLPFKGEESQQTDGEQSPVKGMVQSQQTDGCKGIGIKVANEGREGRTGTTLPSTLSEEVLAHVAATTRITLSGAAAGWTDFRGRKLLFSDDVAGRSAEEVVAMFVTWLTTNTPGKVISAKFRVKSTPPPMAPPPEGWRAQVQKMLSEESWGPNQEPMEQGVRDDRFDLLPSGLQELLRIELPR